MHSLEIYSIRVYDHLLPGGTDERYCDLLNVRGRSLVELLSTALVSGEDEFVDIREMLRIQNPDRDLRDIPRRIFKCSSVVQNGNLITGYLNVGEYGTENNIVNRLSGATVGQVEVDQAVIRDHFFYIQIRPGERQALFFIQAIRGKGAKTIFEEVIRDQVRQRTGGLGCQIRPLAHRGLVNDWYANAEVCEIRMSKFADNDAYNDIADRLGDSYTEIKIKPKSRNARLGRLADLDNALIDYLRTRAGVVKAQVEYNGRRRVFQLGVDDEPVSSIELDEEDPMIVFENGNPTYESTMTFAQNLATDMWLTIG